MCLTPKNLSHPISAIPCLILFPEFHLPDQVCDTPGPSDTPLIALSQGNMLPTPKLQGGLPKPTVLSNHSFSQQTLSIFGAKVYV